MKILLDTHLLLWALSASRRVPHAAALLLKDLNNEAFFSTIAIWEVAIKHARQRQDFLMHPSVFHRGLLEAGYKELSITSQHVLFLDALPVLHKDPFDRLLIAQATIEGMILLTKDKLITQYPGPIQKV